MAAFKNMRIVQGYLCSDPERTVRVRLMGRKGYLTVKGKGNAGGMSRFEWEKEISEEDASALLKLCQSGMIDKIRYYVRNTDGVHTWEVDEFHGANEGLVLAEIELQSETDSFDRPEWLGEEVTGNPAYYNSSLVQKGK